MVDIWNEISTIFTILCICVLKYHSRAHECGSSWGEFMEGVENWYNQNTLYTYMNFSLTK